MEREELESYLRDRHQRLAEHLEGDAISSQLWQSTCTMAHTKVKRAQWSQTSNKAKPDLPWNVILHNDRTDMVRVVYILKKVIPGMTFKRATKLMWQAHTTGQAVVKSCHKELAELYEERLNKEKLTVSIDKAG